MSNQSAYDAWLTTLSERARASLTSSGEGPCNDLDEEEQEFDAWLSTLSPAARAVISACKPEAPASCEVTPDETVYEYAGVECQDGESPVVRLFRTAEALARHIGKLEGRDVYFMPFHGTPLGISIGPTRYLSLPDGDSLLMVPVKGEGACRRIDAELVEFELQDDGYLGPYELGHTHVVASKLTELAEEGAPEEDDDGGEEI